MNESATSRTFHCFDPLDAGRNWSNYRSRAPVTRDELFSYSHLVLGHFTSTTFLPSILAHGLIPDYNHDRIMDRTLPSDRHSVYLCARYDRFYIDRVIKHHGGAALAIVVNLPVAALAPDECALSPVDRKRHPLDSQLFLSLSFGACKHPGVIPTSCFVGIYDVNGEKLDALGDYRSEDS